MIVGLKAMAIASGAVVTLTASATIGKYTAAHVPYYAGWYCEDRSGGIQSIIAEGRAGERGRLEEFNTLNLKNVVCDPNGTVVESHSFDSYVTVGKRQIALYRVVIDNDAGKPIVAYTSDLSQPM
jgi:hypothetical protein